MEPRRPFVTRSVLVRLACLAVVAATWPGPASHASTTSPERGSVAGSARGCPRDQVVVTAHRGTGPGTRTVVGRAYSENSIEAFRAALHAGADGVETDYWPTADGRVVAHHDATLDRMTTERGSLPRRRWARIRSAVLPSGDRVPTFGAVAAALAPYDAHRQQEIKDGSVFSDRQLRRMLTLDVAAGAYDRLLYTSSQRETLERIRAIDPQVRLGLIGRDRRGRPRLARIPDWLDVVLVDVRAASAPYVARAAATGVEVSARGVNTVAELHRAVAKGITRVVTDRPELVGRSC